MVVQPASSFNPKLLFEANTMVRSAITKDPLYISSILLVTNFDTAHSLKTESWGITPLHKAF